MSHILWFRTRCWQIIGWLGAALAIALLQACSAVKLAYDNAPDLGYWWLDSYVEFNDEQSARVRVDLAQLLAWHRRHDLPRTAELLKRLQTLAAAPLTPAQACTAMAEVRTHLEPLLAQAEPIAAELAPSLSAAQLAHLEQRLHKNNVDYLGKWAEGSRQERHARRLKAAVERHENLYGTLENAQVAVLQASVAASAFDFDRSYAERRRRQQDLLQTLRQIATEKTSGPSAQAAVRALLERSLESPQPTYRAYSARMTQESCETLAAVHNAATSEQRARAVRRLGAYERDARELAVRR